MKILKGILIFLLFFGAYVTGFFMGRHMILDRADGVIKSTVAEVLDNQKTIKEIDETVGWYRQQNERLTKALVEAGVKVPSPAPLPEHLRKK